jgi:hypothetical protein
MRLSHSITPFLKLLFILTIFIHLNNGQIHEYPDSTIIEQSGEFREHYAKAIEVNHYNQYEFYPGDTVEKLTGWSFDESTTYIIPKGLDGYALGIYRKQDIKKITRD